MARYVALLRGINVGGKNLIKMSDLTSCFERHGFEDVTTYIQSGNVVFGSTGTTLAALTERVEAMLATSFGYEASVVIRTKRQLQEVVEGAPEGFGAEPDRYRYDVIFLMPPLSAPTAMRSVHTKDGVDRAWAGRGVLYFSRLTARASQSQLSRIVSMPIYRQMTIRNWNTTTELLRLMG
jgi:uncharacterized protein (DUF1697 family)